MKYTIYKKSDNLNGHWAGGESKELAVFPDHSSYAGRNFIWRLAVMSSDKDEAGMAKLEDYNRVIMVLQGEAVISYEGQRVARLAELEQDRTDGEWKTKIYGQTTVLDLLVRKGCEGYMDVISPGETAETYPSAEETSLPLTTHAFYCHNGYAVISFGNDSHMIKEGETMILSSENGEAAEYQIMGEGATVRAQIFYDEMEGVLGPQIIPEEKATLDDFKQCVFLANVQFRFAGLIVKKLRTTWFDEALSGAIRKIEKRYLTFIAFLLGLGAVCALCLNMGFSTGLSLAAIAGWIIFDSLVVSPLIYLAIVPKPVRRHMKPVDELTPYEQKVRSGQINKNERVENIMKKYKTSGRTGREEE